MKRYLAIIAIVLALIATLVFAQNQNTQQTPIPAPQDSELKAVWFPFNGAWMPDQDASLIGPKNYKTLKNLRYNDTALEGVNGYSKINTTGTTPYTDIRNGIQLTSDRTTRSYVIVQAQTDAGLGQILYNTTAVPSQGDFSGTTLHSDTTGFDLPRFSQAPNGNIAYANSKESMIWAGDEMRVSGLFLCSGVSTNLTNPVDYTDAVNDTLQTSGHYFTVSSGASSFLVFSTRPLSGVKFYVKSASVTATGLSAWYWSGTTFTSVTNAIDGTLGGVTSFAQTGTYTFDSTVSTAKPYYFQGLYLYAYAFNLNYGSADIYHVSAKAPFQNIVDVWDGVYRQPITFQYGYNDTGTNINYEDYTLEVNEASYPTVPIGAVLDGMRVQDHVIIMFDDRMAGIKWDMLAGLANTSVSGATLDYWSGATWVTVSNFTDGTKSGTSTLVSTGVMTWTPPSGASEFKQTLFGQTGYAYRFRLASGNLSGTHGDATEELYIDQVTGIPAQLEVKPFKFPSMYKNRLLLAGYTEGKEGNRVDYSASNAPDVWNGEDSSKDGIQSLFFGGSEPLTAGTQLYNRVGSNIFATWVAFKETEMYLLTGDNKEDFKIYPVSFDIGCPAPLTVATASMNIAEGADVNVIMWLSNRGPMMFDLTTPKLIRGVDKYFDPVNSDCINSTYMKNARGWYDPNYREYNLLIPSGSTATTNNVWLVYDVIRKKWYQKDTGTGEMPQCGFQVMDTNGKKYVYGGIDTGYMVRLENSYRWDTTAITQTIETGDFFPSENPWEITRIRRVKLASKVTSEDCDVTVTHYNNTSDSSGVTVALVALDSGTSERVTRDTQPFNLDAWSHRFKFSTTTTTTLRGFSPILWGMEYLLQRRDHITINPFTETPTIHQVSDSRSLYYVNYLSADQGVDDNDSSLKDLCESVIGPSRRATVVFKHWRLSGTADTTYTVGTAIDLSTYTNINFQFEKGAVLSGVTVTFPSTENVLAAPDQYIIAASTPLRFATGGKFHPGWWRAKGDGSTNDYTALQAAIDSYKATMTTLTTAGYYYDSHQGPTFELLPGRIYVTETSLYTGGSVTSCLRNLNGNGATILGKTLNEPIIVATGAHLVNWENFTIEGDPTTVASCGIFLSRPLAGTGSGFGHYLNVHVIGSFTYAPVYNYASEINNWDNCAFYQYAGHSAFILTNDNNRAVAVAAGQAIAAGAQSSITQTFKNCSFYTADATTGILTNYSAVEIDGFREVRFYDNEFNTVYGAHSTGVNGAWALGVDYVSGVSSVTSGATKYLCKVSHTSAAGDEPGVGANWTTYWDAPPNRPQVLIKNTSVNPENIIFENNLFHSEYQYAIQVSGTTPVIKDLQVRGNHWGGANNNPDYGSYQLYCDKTDGTLSHSWIEAPNVSWNGTTADIIDGTYVDIDGYVNSWVDSNAKHYFRVAQYFKGTLVAKSTDNINFSGTADRIRGEMRFSDTGQVTSFHGDHYQSLLSASAGKTSGTTETTLISVSGVSGPMGARFSIRAGGYFDNAANSLKSVILYIGTASGVTVIPAHNHADDNEWLVEVDCYAVEQSNTVQWCSGSGTTNTSTGTVPTRLWQRAKWNPGINITSGNTVAFTAIAANSGDTVYQNFLDVSFK